MELKIHYGAWVEVGTKAIIRVPEEEVLEFLLKSMENGRTLEQAWADLKHGVIQRIRTGRVDAT